MNVLISLYKGYGLGDAVQMSAVLRHVRKYRPHWVVDFQAEPGRETVGRGIAHNIFCYGQQPFKEYEAEVQIVLHDTFANWHDRPNTRVTSCLYERFGIEWDPACARYEVNVPTGAHSAVADCMRWRHCTTGRMVALHYQGDSAKDKKDLSHEQMSAVIDWILERDYTPLLLDWRGSSPLSIRRGVKTLGRSEDWGRSAMWNCAVIRQCEAFVGIDSGPSKCASATDTPACVVWTGHHPAPFHDPAPNTTHLVPVGYNGLEPVCGDPGVVRWFEANYAVREYRDPVEEVKKWLEGVLRC